MATIIVSAILVVAVFFAVKHVWQNHKKGGCSSCGSSAGCSSCCGCTHALPKKTIIARRQDS